MVPYMPCHILSVPCCNVREETTSSSTHRRVPASCAAAATAGPPTMIRRFISSRQDEPTLNTSRRVRKCAMASATVCFARSALSGIAQGLPGPRALAPAPNATANPAAPLDGSKISPERRRERGRNGESGGASAARMMFCASEPSDGCHE